MATFYLSSTFEDLKECRESVSDALRKMNHRVVGMENYTAGGAAPLKTCLEDVAGCDAYIGIIAWRYGYVPEDDNPARKSITELEYLKAIERGMETFIFVLDEEAHWPLKYVDADKRQIESLRRHVSKKHLVGVFKNCAELTVAVMAAASKLPPSEDVRGGAQRTEGEVRVREFGEHKRTRAPSLWKRYWKLALVCLAALALALSFAAYRSYVKTAPPPPPDEYPNRWDARFTRNLDEHWLYSKGSWDTEPGEESKADEEAMALLVSGGEVGIPKPEVLGGRVFYDFKAVFRIRFKKGAGGAWVLRAQPDRRSGYLFEIGKSGRGRGLQLIGYIYDQNRKDRFGEEPLPLNCCGPTQALTIEVTAADDKFDYVITFEDDDDDNPENGKEVRPTFRVGERDLRWRWGTFGFLGTQDGSVMKVENLTIFPLPKES